MRRVPVLDDFVKWCDEFRLQLNSSKTKDVIVDFRKRTHAHEVKSIKGQTG